MFHISLNVFPQHHHQFSIYLAIGLRDGKEIFGNFLRHFRWNHLCSFVFPRKAVATLEYRILIRCASLGRVIIVLFTRNKPNICECILIIEMRNLYDFKCFRNDFYFVYVILQMPEYNAKEKFDTSRRGKNT